MIPPLFVRLTRWIGWIALAGSAGVVWSVTIWDSVHGPEAGQSAWPSAQVWTYYATTLGMAGGVVLLSHVIAVPITFALVHSNRRRQVAVVAAASCVPLLTMPNVFTYAWDLLMNTRIGVLKPLVDWVPWNAPGAAPLQATWILAMWLWPVPVLVLATAYAHAGRSTLQMASLDASSGRAFVRAVLPGLRPALIASAAIVFVLAVSDSTVCSLTVASKTWSYDLMTQARNAGKYARPAAFLFWKCWPMLATLGVLVLIALPSIRRVGEWIEQPPSSDTGGASAGGRWMTRLGVFLAVMLVALPILSFAIELATRPERAEGMFSRVRVAFGDATLGTIAVGLLTGFAAIAVAVASFGGSFRTPPSRVGGAVVVLLALTAVLPPELIGTALVRFYGDKHLSPPGSWNLYDDTLIVWTAAMLARFGFLTACTAHLLTQRAGRAACAQAAVDGADRDTRIANAELSIAWRPLLLAGAVVGCLSISEVATSVLVQPIRPEILGIKLGGSLAVAVDSQMHFGREDTVVAASLLLMLPAIAVAVLLSPAGIRRSSRPPAPQPLQWTRNEGD